MNLNTNEIKAFPKMPEKHFIKAMSITRKCDITLDIEDGRYYLEINKKKIYLSKIQI